MPSIRRLGGRLAVIGRKRAVFDLLVCLENRAVPVFPCDGVHSELFRIHGGVSRIFGNFVNIRRPALEGVCVLGVCRLCGRRAVIFGHCTVFYRISLKNRAVFVLPCHSVFVNSGSIYGNVCHISGNFVNIRRPALEGISVLSICRLGGRCAVIGRRCAVGYIFVFLKNRTVPVFPCDGVRLRLPLSVQHGIACKCDGCTVVIGSAAAVLFRVPSGKVVSGARECVAGKREGRILLLRQSIHATISAVSVEGNTDIVSRMPLAVVSPPSVRTARSSTVGRGVLLSRADILTVVVQLGGSDWNGNLIISVCIILIGLDCRPGSALLNVLASAAAGADVRAACGGVDGTDSRQAAVYIHLGILQVCIGAGIGFAGRIGNRLELASAPDKVVGIPLVTVVNVDILTVGDSQIGTIGNAYLNASQQCGILVDGDLSGLNVDGDVVGDGEYIVCGVDTRAS